MRVSKMTRCSPVVDSFQDRYLNGDFDGGEFTIVDAVGSDFAPRQVKAQRSCWRQTLPERDFRRKGFERGSSLVNFRTIVYFIAVISSNLF